ncbi:MAG: fumarylacetoacetate hydrolase family protein [Fimbriimonadaceae bacterium]|nr:fumarylacetoacetate hydrolase family protein [Fimbriimonadaceae bacterium]QYK55107.1 MAG: fumarylacetoacetate hydrolase family protein [Fimbriimonadaceae bacterium]
MKLCRFELRSQPGPIRSGLVYDSRYYETDGERAIGIHEPGAVTLLPPIGVAPSLRLFDVAWQVNGGYSISFDYLNPSAYAGPAATVEMPESTTGMDFEIRVAGVVHEGGRSITHDEAPSFILGYGILVSLFDPEAVETARVENRATTPARDLGGFFGPFLVTPDELSESVMEGDPTRFRWTVEAHVNGENVMEDSAHEDHVSFSDLIHVASATTAVNPSDLLAWPAIRKPRLDSTAFGRLLAPEDEIRVTIEPLGTLVGRIG